MRSTHSYSIKNKLTWMNMLVSGGALLVASVAFAAHELSNFRLVMARGLSIEAQMVASNSVSAILFGDPESARNTLSALSAAPHIVSAGIFTPGGQPFAVYFRDQTSRSLAAIAVPNGQQETYSFTNSDVTLARSIMSQDKFIGTVTIRSDLRELTDRLTHDGVIVVAALLISLIAAFALSSMFQRAVTRPIVQLAQVAQIVSREKRYSVRAPITKSYNEIVVLVEAFNEMLAQIQEREAALHQAHEQLNLALKSSGVGTWNWSIAEDIVTWDNYMMPLFGLDSVTFSGKYEDFLNLVHPDDRKRMRAAAAASVEVDAAFDNEFQVVWPDGALHALSVRGKVDHNEGGQAERMAGACWDITARKLAEGQVRELNQTLERRVAERTVELEVANKEMGAFTYSVAHDLRAPLRHIQGFSDALLEEFASQLDPGAKQYLHRIIASTQHMGRLITDLLDLAHVGRQELRLQLTGLASLVQEVLGDLSSETEGRNIQWRIGGLPFVECDPGLAKQVFYNLVSNAVKYSRPRDPAIIEIGHTVTNGEKVIFVRDNGVGFNMKYAAKLFGVFQRLHRREDFEGTGVGLATVQRIVQKHGGHIWAEAAIDKGATFCFTLGSDGELAEDKDANLSAGATQ